MHIFTLFIPLLKYMSLSHLVLRIYFFSVSEKYSAFDRNSATSHSFVYLLYIYLTHEIHSSINKMYYHEMSHYVLYIFLFKYCN